MNSLQHVRSHSDLLIKQLLLMPNSDVPTVYQALAIAELARTMQSQPCAMKSCL